MAPKPAQKRVELTTINQNSGKPITSFLDYSPRTVDPPRINDATGFFDMASYEAYLSAYDIYIVKFFQVRRQFLHLHRGGVPTVPVNPPIGEFPLASRLLRATSKGNVGVVGPSYTIPVVPIVPPRAPAPSEELKKERRKNARKRRSARRKATSVSTAVTKVESKIQLVKAKSKLASVEAGWTLVQSRASKKRAARKATSKKKTPASTGDGSPPPSRSTSLARRPAVRGRGRGGGRGS